LLLILLVTPAVAYGAGGHEMLSCTGCHGIHTAKGDIIFEVEPNKVAVNPRTQKPFVGVTALCLGCHETQGGMGIKPIAAKHSHPYGIKPDPKVAAVPSAALRDGKLECVGCHDPHPSNPNHRYLRIDTAGGAKMETFCSLCHSSKSGKQTPASEMFSSMDERKKAVPAKKAPAKKK
jgi:predicted CXXCH cytochrome family protein